MNWKKSYPFKDPYHMNQMMLHGNGRTTNLVFGSCMYSQYLTSSRRKMNDYFIKMISLPHFAVFVNFLPIKANQVLNVILYRPSLKWLYLLVLVAALPIKRKSHSLLDNWVIQFAFMQYVNRVGTSGIVWHIK